MRRIVVLLTIALMMAMMMVTIAAPAFAIPNDPVRGLHGQQVSFVARTVPPNPIHGPLVSSVARGISQCGVVVDNCPGI